MTIKDLSDEELISLYKEHNCSFLAIETVYNLSKNFVGRLFNKRGINYHYIKKLESIRIRKEYDINPKYCKYCGNIIPFEDRNRKYFCNQSCSASYYNILRTGHTERQSPNPKEKYYCLSCGKELNYCSSSTMKYCSPKCLLDYNYKQYIEDWKNGEKSGISGRYDISSHIRRYLFEKYNSSCQLCGWNKINPTTNKVPLQIHHIDGNCLNNKEANLLLLCPNCHSLTETFGNLNKTSARIFRVQKENV